MSNHRHADTALVWQHAIQVAAAVYRQDVWCQEVWWEKFPMSEALDLPTFRLAVWLVRESAEVNGKPITLLQIGVDMGCDSSRVHRALEAVEDRMERDGDYAAIVRWANDELHRRVLYGQQPAREVPRDRGLED